MPPQWAVRQVLAACECPHVELPEMRKLILEWMDAHLVAPASKA